MDYIVEEARRQHRLDPKASVRTLSDRTAKRIRSDVDGMAPQERRALEASCTAAVKRAKYEARSRNYLNDA